MSTSVEERSIFSYPIHTYQPTARELVEKNENINLDKQFTNIIDCPSEVHCTLPDGICIKNQPTVDRRSNWGIYATKIFARYSIIFITEPNIYIHDKDVNYKLVIDPNGPVLDLNTLVHSNKCAKGVRHLPTYGTLLNHSCDANCYLDCNHSELEVDQPLAAVALRDIQIGDEITCNYNLFAYSMSGFISKCNCQMASCNGFCFGFKYLNEYEQEKLLPYAVFNIQVAYWLDKKNDH